MATYNRSGLWGDQTISMSRRSAASAALAAIALTSCAVGPDFKRPDASQADRYIESPLPDDLKSALSDLP